MRISLGGGGTDLPSFYEKYGGYFISASINKYVYVAITRPFKRGIYLKYSKIEKCNNINHIRHKIIREALRIKKISSNQIEITTLTDIPAGTGLGSSGSFTTCLIKALYEYNCKFINGRDLAEIACDIEINKLDQPSGKQDQYISVFGGITKFEINKEGYVNVRKLNISKNTIYNLHNNLLLFFTGFTRNSSLLLKDQKIRSLNKDNEILDNLKLIKNLAKETNNALLKNNLNDFGRIMNEHWNIKIKRSIKMSNKKINSIYNYALRNGAIGGKLIGAGGGGFLLFYSDKPEYLRRAMEKKKIQEIRFNFDSEGVKRVLWNTIL